MIHLVYILRGLGGALAIGGAFALFILWLIAAIGEFGLYAQIPALTILGALVLGLCYAAGRDF